MTTARKPLDPPDFLVAPSATDGDARNYSDTSMANVFGTHVANINAGKQLIWQRFNVLAVANSGLLAFTLARVPTRQYYAHVYCAFGLLLCVAWGILNAFAWAHNLKLISLARRFRWQLGPHEEPNVMSAEYLALHALDWNRTGWRKDYIFLAAQSVVLLYAVGHIAVLIGRL